MFVNPGERWSCDCAESVICQGGPRRIAYPPPPALDSHVQRKHQGLLLTLSGGIAPALALVAFGGYENGQQKGHSADNQPSEEGCPVGIYVESDAQIACELGEQP